MRWMLIAVPILVAAAPVTVTGTHFLLERASGDDTVDRVETTQIPFEPEVACYRWVIEYKAGKGVHPFRERMVLPAPAAQWGGVDGNPESATRVDRSRRISDTALMAALDTGIVSNGWCVAEGDPQGRYRIDVYDGARLLHRFDFTVGGIESGDDAPNAIKG